MGKYHFYPALASKWFNRGDSWDHGGKKLIETCGSPYFLDLNLLQALRMHFQEQHAYWYSLYHILAHSQLQNRLLYPI